MTDSPLLTRLSPEELLRIEYEAYLTRAWERGRFNRVLNLMSQEGQDSVRHLAVKTISMERKPVEDEEFMSRIGERLLRLARRIERNKLTK